MTRSYIPFYFDKTKKYTLYYDYQINRFFISSSGKQNSTLALLSGFTGVMIYAFLKDWLLDIGKTSSFTMIILCVMFSGLLGFGVISLTQFIIRKSWDKVFSVPTPSVNELLFYIKQGEKWLKTSVCLIFYLFLFNIVLLVFLYFDPDNGLIFFSNTVLLAFQWLLIWGVRPMKRRMIYAEFTEELRKIKLNEDKQA